MIRKIRYIGHAGTFRIVGPITANRYIFRGHDSVLRVKVDDYAPLLALVRRANPCCGQPAREEPLFAPA